MERKGTGDECAGESRVELRILGDMSDGTWEMRVRMDRILEIGFQSIWIRSMWTVVEELGA